ncbi:putative Transposase-associated domain-containing protein [Helianthus annuus]|nr:putative Transposase-associated domain-containing protein [Helianthus annuus]
MSSDREWMYGMRFNKDGTLNMQFQQRVDYFLDFAYEHATNIEEETIGGVQKLLIRCPCSKCKNRYYKTRNVVDCHLTSLGFMKDYQLWYAHGESEEPMGVDQCSNPIPSQHVGQDVVEDIGEYTEYDQMVMECMHQDPNQEAHAFYRMLEQANEPLWEGCKDASTLSITTRLLNWKSDCNISDSTFDKLLPIIKDNLPDDNKLPRNFYETKKMLKPLELPSQVIHVCQNHCMLFNGPHSDLDRCIVCNEYRYKERGKKVPKLVMTYMPIGPRLQRLFYSKKTAQHMTWHADRSPSEKMSHPSEGRAWHHFNSVFSDFAKETRNIRLGLCTDGFSPNNASGAKYSCWPVFITVYNLPPWLALKEQYVQIPLIIPGPNNPQQNIDVFLQPLVDELKQLFTHGIETYDAHRCENFKMKAVLLWTVSDFPAYAMLSGWSTHGKLACPYCSNESGSFRLPFGGKPCWFDCHRQHLPAKHCFRKDKTNFRKNKMVSRVRDIPQPTGEEIWQVIKEFPIVYDGKPYGTERYEKPPGFGITHNWVKRSIFWELPYWSKLLIRHNLDVMHIEKNVFDNLFHTIMGTNTSKDKDNMKARQDMERICDRFHLNPTCDNNGKMTKNRGNYTL